MQKIENYLIKNDYLSGDLTDSDCSSIKEEDLINFLRDTAETPTRVIEGLFFIVANEAMDLKKISELALQNNLQNKVGYLLDTINSKFFNKNPPEHYKDILKYIGVLYKRMSREKQFFNKFDTLIFGEFSFEELDELERKWKIYSRLDFEHGIYLIKKHTD